MKLASYDIGKRPSYGAVTEAGILDVPTVWPEAPQSLLAALQAGRSSLRRIAELTKAATGKEAVVDEALKPAVRRIESLIEEGKVFLPSERVTLKAPIPHPPKVLGLAVNYLAHHDECSRDAAMPDSPGRTTTPRPFLMPATAVAGPGAQVPWPAFSRDVDHEVELAAVIGSPASRVPVKDALGHVAGYTIADDVSARSVTHAQGRAERPKDAFFDWLHGKWADGFCPMGPWLVTADEVGDPQELAIELAVDGDVRQQSHTGRMIHTVAEIVSFCSHLMTLTPGDVIATGTPSGVGAATGKLLAGGETITCRIEKIGELTHTIGRPPKQFYRPCAT